MAAFNSCIAKPATVRMAERCFKMLQMQLAFQHQEGFERNLAAEAGHFGSRVRQSQSFPAEAIWLRGPLQGRNSLECRSPNQFPRTNFPYNRKEPFRWEGLFF